ncbi:MAG: penicillin acylase family protein [Pirellulales bacterium]
MEAIIPKNARRKFTAVRDEAGVPHIEAGSWREALYALGYVHALDRPTQMLFGRAVASGRSAEQIAATDQLLETDRFFRRVGLYRNLQDEVDQIDHELFDQLTFYCEGVNHGLKDSGRSLPMWATGFRPQPWNQHAVLLIGKLLSFGGLAIGQQENERLLLELIQLGVDEARMKELFFPHLESVDFELLKQIKITRQLSDEALELISDLPRLAGSNAWAVAPWRSATGHALLASDPHLEVNRLPAIWYEVVLHWQDEYVMGATLPGCPLFAVARTSRLAWGVTYLKGDTSDYFIEDCRQGDEGGWQYRRDDRWHDFRLREEIILQKGTVPETMRVYENDQGTLVGDPEDEGPGYYLSASWVGDQGGASRAIGTWIDLPAMNDAASAMEMVRECPYPSLVWMFTDCDGHIGMQAGGWFPKRPETHTGLLPLPAWDADNHWRGRLSSRVLPGVYDPPEGFLASANENINPPGGPDLTTLTLPDYRKRRIVERLEELPSATVEDMQALQYDVVSLHARELLPIFLPHMPESEQKTRLANWDFRYTPESREAALFQHLYRNVVLEIFGHEEGIGWLRMLYICTRAGYSTMVLTCVDKLLKREHSLWWAKRTKAALIHKAAVRLAEEKDAPWSEVNAFHFTNRFFEGRRVGRVLGFNTPRMAMPGCHATPFQGHLLTTATRETSFAPSYHFVTDMGTDEIWTNLPGGPSESRFSRYYKNDIANWASGVYKRVTPHPDPIRAVL